MVLILELLFLTHLWPYMLLPGRHSHVERRPCSRTIFHWQNIFYSESKWPWQAGNGYPKMCHFYYDSSHHHCKPQVLQGEAYEGARIGPEPTTDAFHAVVSIVSVQQPSSSCPHTLCAIFTALLGTILGARQWPRWNRAATEGRSNRDAPRPNPRRHICWSQQVWREIPQCFSGSCARGLHS